jgi:hypothetical protein
MSNIAPIAPASLQGLGVPLAHAVEAPLYWLFFWYFGVINSITLYDIERDKELTLFRCPAAFPAALMGLQVIVLTLDSPAHLHLSHTRSP